MGEDSFKLVIFLLFLFLFLFLIGRGLYIFGQENLCESMGSVLMSDGDRVVCLDVEKLQVCNDSGVVRELSWFEKLNVTFEGE